MCNIIRKPFKLPFLKHEMTYYYDVEFYLPYDDEHVKMDFTHNILLESNSLVISIKFPDNPAYIPYGVTGLEIFESSETLVHFEKPIQSKSDVIIKEGIDGNNQIVIRVFKLI